MARAKAKAKGRRGGYTRWDPSDSLHSEADIAAYLKACVEESDGDPALLVAALGDVARARGMMELAKETGLTREGLYRALGGSGNPSFETVSKVVRSMGLKMTFVPLD